MANLEHILLIGALLLIISILASKAFGRFGVPGLLLFLTIGMLAGSEGIIGIEFDNLWLAQSVGIVALIFILFSGGLDTSFQSIRNVLSPGILLASISVLLTALLVGAFTFYIFKLSWLEAFLLGAIVSSTDAAAVFSVLRGMRINLKERLQALLELESGSNDPMAVFLTVGLIGLIQAPEAQNFDLIIMFFQQMAIGALAGYGLGRLSVLFVNKLKLEYEGLYPVLMIAIVLLSYGGTTSIGGNGFLAVYILGLILGNSPLLHKQSLTEFHDSIAWLMQICVFLTLGLLVFPSQLIPVAAPGLLISAFLILIARPLSVFAVLPFFEFRMKDNLLVSWVGLRGAVPIILAIFPLLAGLPRADEIFHLVFFIVLTSILIQGPSIPFVAKRLKVTAPYKRKDRSPIQFRKTHAIRSELVDIEVPTDSPVIGKPLIELGFPENFLVVLVNRQGEYFPASGRTSFEAGDQLLALADHKAKKEIQKIIAPDKKQPKAKRREPQ